MKQALVISGRIPNEIVDLAEAYHAFYGDTDVQCVRIWYAMRGEVRIPAWLLTRFVSASGCKCSAIFAICNSKSAGLCLNEHYTSERANEGVMLKDWQRLMNESEDW